MLFVLVLLSGTWNNAAAAGLWRKGWVLLRQGWSLRPSSGRTSSRGKRAFWCRMEAFLESSLDWENVLEEGDAVPWSNMGHALGTGLDLDIPCGLSMGQRV